MELMILFALAVWASAGPVGHMRKTEPLRIAARRQYSAQAHERRMARVGRRGGRPTIAEAMSIRIAERITNPRGGPARTALTEWWADSWLWATERRRWRHARAAVGQLRRQRAARAAKQWVAARWAQRRAQGAPKRPRNDPWARARTHQPGFTTAEASRPWPSGGDEDIVDAELVEEEDNQPAQPSGPGDNPRQATAGTAGATPTESTGADGPRQPVQPSDNTSGNDRSDNPTAESDDLASVHPIRPTTDHQPTRKGTVMTIQTSGETLDPAAGRAFVDSVRQSTEQIRSQVELSQATLTSRGISGEPIEHLAAVQEALSMVVATCERVIPHFERHLGIQDQVMADPTLVGAVQNTYIGQRS